MIENLNKILYHGIWLDNNGPTTEGGLDCYEEIDNYFRIFSHLIAVIFSLCMIIYG